MFFSGTGCFISSAAATKPRRVAGTPTLIIVAAGVADTSAAAADNGRLLTHQLPPFINLYFIHYVNRIAFSFHVVITIAPFDPDVN